MKNVMIFVANYRRVFRAAAIVVLMTICGGISAQTVSISPNTGNVVSNLSYEQESSLDKFGGIWIHNQLPMTLITSDKSGVNSDGLMKEHANNVSAQGDCLIFASGSSSSTINHMSLSLPKGYRFTSYKLVMDYDTSNKNKAASVFKEMDSKFSSEMAKVTVGKNQKNITLQRTSLNDEDMGNILYFRQEHSDGMARVKVVSFVITFECTDKFGEILRPKASDLSSSAVSCVSLPFQTQRVDLGEIKWADKNGYKSYKYDYGNVKDLVADFLFYDESGIENGHAKAGKVGNGNIKELENKDSRTFLGVKNSTYWLETPAEALSQDGVTEIPVGYRIVGARVVYSNTIDPDIQIGDDIYITDGNGRYMNANLKFTTTKVKWKYDNNKHVSTQNGSSTVYLRHVRENWPWSQSLGTTTNSSKASSFETDGLNLYCYSSNNRYVISYDDSGNAGFGNAQQYAVVWDVKALETGNHSFKLSVYDKTGENIFKTVEVDKDHPFGDIVLEKINNDAIKLQVEGLEGDNLAYLCLEVQLEALNPYIDKMDITCTEPDGNKTLKNQYLADDFTIGLNGKVDFAVPTNFGTQNLKFAFEGLHHKNADETYTNIGTQGQYSRYHFVQSDYYNLIGENLQGHRAEAADHDYTKKIAVGVAGDKQFVCNNSANFAAGTSGSGKFYYTEYRYSNAEYSSQGGTWSEVTADSGDDYKKLYLIVCDETRYNIAPTTKPRHTYYAYYSTDLKLTTVDYTPEITYTKVYDNGVLPAGPDANMYVGAKVSLKDKSSGNAVSDGTGYVYAKQIVDQINGDINNKVPGAPVDAKHILYFDASELNSVLFSSTDESWGKLEDLQQILGENALIYLPQGVTYGMKNIATRSLAGDDFVASNDMEIQDQKPFFAPYKIRMNAANEVKYTRLVTNNNDTKKWVSLVLPFTIAVDKATGEYKTMGDNGEFTFYKMNGTNAFSNAQDVDEQVYDVDAHFSPYTGQEVTQANYPYLVGIDRLEAGTIADKLLFIVRQRGATIEASPASLAGETSSGTVKGAASTLQCYGTYSGTAVPKENGILYFNKDKFVSSLVLDNRYTTVKVLPFRSYYVSENPTRMRYMYISTDENTEGGTSNIGLMPNSISNAGFAFSASEGQLTLTTLKDMAVTIRSISGQTISAANMTNGQTQSFTLPGGIYLVNGTKVVVR